VARIEVGAVDPRFGTLTRLLRECGETLSAERLTTGGVDMGQIRNRLLMKPGDRLRASVVATNNVRALLRGASHGGGSDVD
jgi:predicted transcriptional regulator